MSEYLSEQAAEIDLDAIRARAAEWWGEGNGIAEAADVIAKVPSLVAEVERLREELRRQEILTHRMMPGQPASWPIGQDPADWARARLEETRRSEVERDEARAVLGAVAALADEFASFEKFSRSNDLGQAAEEAEFDRVQRRIADTWHEAEGRLRAVLAPVSGAVEGRYAHIDRSDPAAPVITIDRADRSGAVEVEPGACPEHGPGNALIGGAAACVHIDPKLVDGAVAKPEPDTLTLSDESMEAVGTSIQNAAGGVDFPLPEYVAFAIAENLIASTWLRDRLVAKHEQEVRRATGERIALAIEQEASRYFNSPMVRHGLQESARIARADALTDKAGS